MPADTKLNRSTDTLPRNAIWSYINSDLRDFKQGKKKTWNNDILEMRDIFIAWKKARWDESWRNGGAVVLWSIRFHWVLELEFQLDCLVYTYIVGHMYT